MGILIFALLSESYSEKQPLEENTQNYIQKNQTYLSCARKLYKEIKLQGQRLIVIQRDYIEIVMNKTKVEVYREVLRYVFQNFEGAENFMKQQIEEICE